MFHAKDYELVKYPEDSLRTILQYFLNFLVREGTDGRADVIPP